MNSEQKKETAGNGSPAVTHNTHKSDNLCLIIIAQKYLICQQSEI